LGAYYTDFSDSAHLNTLVFLPLQAPNFLR
jgi:hypothetical protein